MAGPTTPGTSSLRHRALPLCNYRSVRTPKKKPPPPRNPSTNIFLFASTAHTATESGYNQAEMIYMVRIVQSFHIESRGWDDIGYNFLIGGDGNVYEGRGWRKMGSHTYGYNRKGLGISFVGTFMNMLPPQVSLDCCKLLIAK